MEESWQAHHETFEINVGGGVFVPLVDEVGQLGDIMTSIALPSNIKVTRFEGRESLKPFHQESIRVCGCNCITQRLHIF